MKIISTDKSTWELGGRLLLKLRSYFKLGLVGSKDFFVLDSKVGISTNLYN